VHPTNIERIVQAEAYILFYIRTQAASPKPHSSQQVTFICMFSFRFWNLWCAFHIAGDVFVTRLCWPGKWS